MAVRATAPRTTTTTVPTTSGAVVAPDPFESAREAGLRYVSDEKPGIRRRRSGKGFRYPRA
jgi:DNA topoisomerase IB